MLEKQKRLFVQGYNLEVHDVIKYTRKHHATVIISRASQFYLCDVISRSCNRLSSPSKVRFTQEIKKNKEGERKIRGIAMAQWVNRLWNNIFINLPPLPLSCEVSGALHLAQPGLTAGWQADWKVYYWHTGLNHHD